jgi:flagellar L-ring protein FlgH
MKLSGVRVKRLPVIQSGVRVKRPPSCNWYGLSLSFTLTPLLLAGCATSQPDVDSDFPRISVQRAALPSQITGSIYTAGQDMTLFEDIKARRVGDIVTVLLVEQNSGSKSADTNLNQSTGIGVGAPTAGGGLRPNLAIDMNSANTFTGESGSSQSNSLNGSIAVTVVEVLPGGNLLVQGEKWIQINQGKEFIRLHNTILSTQVADARISYSGTGATENANVIGWAARLIFSPLWPF